MDLTEQSRVQLLSYLKKTAGEFLQPGKLRLSGLRQIIQQRKKPGPQKFHVAHDLPLNLLPVRRQFRAVVLEGASFRLLPRRQHSDIF